jgi:hypothetical protein
MTAPAQNSFATEYNDTHSANQEQPKGAEDHAATSLTKLLRSDQLRHWDNSAADIQLTAISCMVAYRMLVVQQKAVELQPGGSEPPVAKVNVAKGASSMMTRHEAGKLALRCRKMSMETSANSEVRYRAYVAAGFAISTTGDEQVQRIPIVLVPVKIERLRGRGTPYTVSYTGEPLRLNPHIAESCSSHVDQLLRAFESESDLRSYLRAIGRKIHTRLHCRVSANTGLFTLQQGVLEDLSLDDQIGVNLDRSKPGYEFKPLPPVPENFNAPLAARMLRFIDEGELTTALQTFAGNTPTTTPSLPAATPLDFDLSIDDARADKVIKCAQWMCELGLGHWQLTNLKSLPKRIDRMIGNLQTVTDSSFYSRYLQREHQTIGMVLNLYKARQRICNAPLEIEHHAIALHADPETRLLLQKAKIQAASLEQEMEVIHDTFHMSAVPSSTSLHQLIKAIAKREESSQLTNPSYFRARRQLNEILKTHNGLITDNDLQKLDKMASTLRFSELFESDKYYKRYFGSLFHGTRTNWQRLDSVVNYLRNLSYDLGSAALVSRLAEHWPSFQRDFQSIQDALQPAAVSAHQLRGLIPQLIDDNTSLSDAISIAGKLQQKLNTWQSYLNRHTTDEQLTPYIITRQNPSNADAVIPPVELPQRDYDERIYQHIVGVGLSDESIAATAEWLLTTLTHLEIDMATIRRYLDGESSLTTSQHSRVI